MKDGAPYWFPVVTLVVGALGGYLADYLREARTSRRERSSASDAFQRETLIELQDWLLKVARTTVQLHHHDEIEYQRSSTWGRKATWDEHNEANREAIANVHRYRVRVLDDAIRENVSQFVSVCVDATLGAAGDEQDAVAYARASAARREAVEQFRGLNDQVGAELRKLI